MNRKDIATLIYKNLKANKVALKDQFCNSSETIGYFYLDNLLPQDLVRLIYESFPSEKIAVKRKNIREYKYTACQMDDYPLILKEITYAFQDSRVVQLISDICNIDQMQPDKSLYAGGLSIMTKDNFLKPHLDNSHDKDIKNWRVLNVLYYVSPNWEKENGGNLELWPNGLEAKQTEITSKCNRLVVMATHQKSWHSVNKVLVNAKRCCVSNYYFSSKPLEQSSKFHVTTFRARQQKGLDDVVLQLDNKLRMGLRKVFKNGVRENPHQYKSN